MTLPSAIVPSWQDRHIFEEPVGCPGEESSELLEYTEYALIGMNRFQSGWTSDALCGVWQKTHTCSSDAARIELGPVAERLWGVPETLVPWARHTDVCTASPTTTTTLNKCVTVSPPPCIA